MKLLPTKFLSKSLLTFFLLPISAMLAASAIAEAQTIPTSIQISGAVQQSSVKRLGVNLGDQAFYDSSQMLKNLIFQNPGFEGEKYRSIMICNASSANSCTDDNQYSPQPTGFWSGATYSVLTGKSAGMTGTIVSSTKNPNSCSGCGQIIQFDQNVNAAKGDYFVMTQNFPGNGDAGWWDGTGGGGTITTETNDISPNSPGQQAISLNAATSGQSATLTSYFDNENGLSFIQMNGTFAVTFRAKGIGGKNQLGVSVSRMLPSGAKTYLNQTITLTNTWQDYTLTFTATENGTASGTAQLVLGAYGSSVELDDVSLAQTNSDPNNTTPFRDDVVNALKTLNPGTIRMMAGIALGADIPNQLAPVGARYREGWVSGGTTQANIPYGIHEFLQLCQAVGADPWITIPTATSPAEMQQFIQYLTGTGNDQWSALRIARGQSAPWTSVFGRIHIELGNETWNGSFRGESMTAPAYPQWANQVFGSARKTSGYVASKFDLVIDGCESAGYDIGVLAASTQHDSIDFAPYLLYSGNNEAMSTMYGALFAEPEMWTNPGGMAAQIMNAAAAAPTKTNVNIYETNLSPIVGNITQAQLDLLTPSIGGGIGHTLNMLEMMRLGVQYQNAFSLPQYAFRRNDGLTVKLWGMVVDMGTTNRRRPQFLTQAMANAVISGNMLTTVQAGANPTWNQPLSSDSVQLSNAHYLQSFAFQNGGNVSVIVFNLNQTSALPVTFSGALAPVGAVQMTQITSANLTDNNETAQVVTPTSQTLSGFNASNGISVPPFSMTVLTWSAAATQTPTFSVAPGAYNTAQTVAIADATAGAAIYYTTDGSTPTTSSNVYAAPITISATQTINAIAVAPNAGPSAVATAAYTINVPAAMPVFSVAAGTYTSAQNVAISAATSNATIYYTTDGSTPGTGSNIYSGPIMVGSTQTIQAAAIASNYTLSAVASANYTINLPAASPVFSVAAGTYTSAQTVTISDATAAATIYYTTNGSTPTTSSTVYSGPVTIGSTQTLQAVAIASNYSVSSVASANYTINLPAASPVFSVAAGTYTSAQTVAISDATANATIYYTTNGSAPTTSSTVYSGPIAIGSTQTLQAVAIANNYSVSAPASALYTINLPAATPVFSVAPSVYTTAQTVSISDATAGATIYYTTNGSTPTTSSAVYSGPIAIGSTQTLQAVAIAPNYSLSAVASATYTITLPTAAPAFSVAAGTYTSAQTVSISDATAGAVIYYTTNGSAPTSSSTVYSGPITVNATETLQAVAIAPSHSLSPAVSAAYTINLPVAAAAPIALGNGFSGSGMVTLGYTTIQGTALQLTSGGQAQQSAAWYPKQVSVSSFTTDFDFQLPSSTADGFTFTIQNSTKGVWAMGYNGCGLGYQGIGNSVAVAFNLYGTSGNAQTIGVYTNGATPTGSSIDMSAAGINLHNGHVFHAHLVYAGTTLNVTVTDATTGASFTHAFTVNIASTVGSTSAYTGFTGSTGASTAVQRILDWTYKN